MPGWSGGTSMLICRVAFQPATSARQGLSRWLLDQARMPKPAALHQVLFGRHFHMQQGRPVFHYPLSQSPVHQRINKAPRRRGVDNQHRPGCGPVGKASSGGTYRFGCSTTTAAPPDPQLFESSPPASPANNDKSSGLS